MTLFLSRTEVARHCRPLQLLQVLRRGLVDWHQLADPSAGVLPGFPASLAPTNAGPWQLLDAGGAPLAIMNASHLAALTANVTAALACDALSRADSKTVALLGSGLEASGAIKALRLVRSIERIRTYEPDFAANTELALRLQAQLNTTVRSMDSAEAAVLDADLVILTGGVPLPLEALVPGTHVTVMGWKASTQPLAPQIVTRASCFTDSAATMPWAPAARHVGLVLQTDTGRTDSTEITVFFGQKPGYLHLLAAWFVYEGARHDTQLTRFDFEG